MLEFANGPGDLSSILGHVIRKTLKIVLDTSLINVTEYQVRGSLNKFQDFFSSGHFY